MSGSRSRFPSSRIRNMIDSCLQSNLNEERQAQHSSPTMQDVTRSSELYRGTSVPDIVHDEKYVQQRQTSSKLNECKTDTELVNLLYTKDYSMNIPLFDQFSETKTSQNCLPNISKSNDFDLLVQSGDNASSSNLPLNEANTIDLSDAEVVNEIIDLIQSNPKSTSNDRSSSTSVLSFDQTDPFKEYSFLNRVPNISQLDLFSSDDSVKDTNYSPSTTTDDSEKENFVVCRKRKRASRKNVDILKPLTLTHANSLGSEHLHPETVLSSNNTSSNNLNTEPEIDQINSATRMHKNSLDSDNLNPETEDKSAHLVPPNDISSNAAPEHFNVEPDITSDHENTPAPSQGSDSSDEAEDEIPRKRKKYETSLEQRKQEKQAEKRENYFVKPGCGETCYKKCSNNFTKEKRDAINNAFWNLSWTQRRLFIRTSTATAIPKRKYTGSEPKRNPRRTFFFKNDDNTNIDVCKQFFLTTLGYKKTNDFVLYAAEGDLVDGRGLHTKTSAKNRDVINTHVEVQAPHHRREHAPHRRYLPGDVNITLMHSDYCEKHPHDKVSYELYRKHVKQMNIGFTKLGNEECESCEKQELHCKQTSHDPKNNVPEDCNKCQTWLKHHNNYTKARKLYKEHTTQQNDENLYYSTDLQKVIMLPRIDTFKKILFCPRLITFNQTFAPLGQITNISKPFAVLWHDGVSGRKQEDIMSAYYSFFLEYRNVKNINLWMDNCSAQNKNWLLYSLIIHLVNSTVIAADTVTFYYFEPGHTFMSCDQFHHQVEKSMKAKGKLYDFKDFEEAVAVANRSRVQTKTMTHGDFFDCPDFISERRIQNTTPRVYLKDLVQVRFERGVFDILFKRDFDDDFETLRIMTDKYLKNPSTFMCEFKTEPKGIDQSRKQGIITALTGITPPHKMLFWNNMPVTTADSGKNKRSKTRMTV